MALTQLFYTYLDITADTGRVFYVGKGNAARVFNTKRRTQFWKNVATKHGHQRVIAFIGSERGALNREVELIKSHHTYVTDPLYSGIGCNFTTGGDGSFKVSETTRRKMSIAASVRAPMTDELRRHISVSRRGRTSGAVKAAASRATQASALANRGRVRTDEHRRNLSLARKGSKPHCSMCNEPNHRAPQCPMKEATHGTI